MNHQEGIQTTQETLPAFSLPILGASLHKMKQSEAEALVCAIIEYGAYWERFLKELPKPWSTTFSRFYLLRLGEHLQKKESSTSIYANPWYTTLSLASNALHPESFSQAVEVCQPLKQKTGDSIQWNGQLQQFRESIQLRKELRQEIHA